jgi:hypothetical protein
MYADALADSRQDYRFFRTFNLLEAIATEVIPRGQVVVNAQGNQLLKSDGKPYTTNEVRGNVFELLKHVARVSGTQLSSFATNTRVPDPARVNTLVSVAGDLWDELDVWAKIRHAVAHRGTWRLPSGETPNAPRKKLEGRIERLTSGSGGNGTELGGLLMTISRTCETTLHQAIAGRL